MVVVANQFASFSVTVEQGLCFVGVRVDSVSEAANEDSLAWKESEMQVGEQDTVSHRKRHLQTNLARILCRQ